MREFGGEAQWDAFAALAAAVCWVLRQTWVEYCQLQATLGSLADYFGNFWNQVDMLTILLFVGTVVTFVWREWPVSHFPLRVKTGSACKTALALPRPTAAPTATIALQRHHCRSHCHLALLI